MPYMRVSLTQKLDKEKAAELTKELSIACEVIPGKTRDLIIIELEDEKTLYFRSKFQENFIFADIHYAGTYNYQLKSKLTEALFEVFERVLGTPNDCASMTITEHQCWGSRGNLRDLLYSGN